MWAGSSVPMIQLLLPLEKGIKDNNGWTALMWAEDKQEPDVIRAHLPDEACL